ncbi:MAG: hypothetical protein LAP61_15345 [Acidobacteriia bacterium]|nr:hypothetical protein [Terriglobia bacterium]
MTVQALIDTGANCLCLDPSVLNQLQLTPTGISPVNTPTTGQQPVDANQYDVSIVIPSEPGSPPLIQHAVPALEAELLVAQGFHAIIGLNILRSCLLTYDGKNGLFSIAW